MAFEHDFQAFPLLWYRFSVETTLDDAKAFEVATEQAAERARAEGTQVVMVCDCLDVGKAEAPARGHLAEYSKRLRRDHGDSMLPAVALISNPLVRGALTAVSWVAPDAVSGTKVAKDLNAGLALARKVAAEHGLVLPEAAISTLMQQQYPEVA